MYVTSCRSVRKVIVISNIIHLFMGLQVISLESIKTQLRFFLHMAVKEESRCQALLRYVQTIYCKKWHLAHSSIFVV
jgi:hypothetical protein